MWVENHARHCVFCRLTTYELCLLPKVGFPGEGPKERRETHELHDGRRSDVSPRRVLDKTFLPHIRVQRFFRRPRSWAPKCRNKGRSRADYPPMRIVHFSGEALSYGAEEKKREGITVRVVSPAKTLADCFRYRNKIGLEVALEVLRDCYRQRKATMDDLFVAAKVCRRLV
jgi:hypothetical protein